MSRTELGKSNLKAPSVAGAGIGRRPLALARLDRPFADRDKVEGFRTHAPSGAPACVKPLLVASSKGR